MLQIKKLKKSQCSSDLLTIVYSKKFNATISTFSVDFKIYKIKVLIDARTNPGVRIY